MHIKTKRSISFYLTLLFATTFYGAMAMGIFAIFLGDGATGYWLLPVVVGLLALGVFTVVRYYKNAPVVMLDDLGISFSGRQYAWSDLQSVNLTGKKQYKYIAYTPLEGAELKFSSGDVRYLFDSMYRNLWEVKAVLRQRFPADGVVKPQNHHAVYPIAAGITPDISAQQFLYFNGNQFATFNGLALWGALIALLITAVCLQMAAITLVVGILASGCYAGLVYGINYFGVSDQYLVVKKPNFPLTKLFALSELEEVIFESGQKGTNWLRIVLKNFKTYAYPAPSLRDNDWIALNEALTGKGVKVKDENNFVLSVTPKMKKLNRTMTWYVVIYFIITIGAYFPILLTEKGSTTEIVAKILWVLFIIIGVIVMRRLVLRLARKADDPDQVN